MKAYEDYEVLKYQSKLSAANFKIQLRAHEKILHKDFVTEHRKLLLVLDILMISVVVGNLLAVAITNAIVYKEKSEPAIPGGERVDVPMLEANPIQAEAGGYAPHPNGKSIMFSVMKQLYIWAFLIFGYWMIRRIIRTESLLAVLLFIVVLYGVSIHTDLTNNTGYLVGKLLFGRG